MQTQPCVVIDVRPCEEYNAGHAEGSFSFPWEDISLLSCGLPDRDCSIKVVFGAHQNVQDIQGFFVRLRYQSLEMCLVSDIAEPLTLATPKGFCFKPSAFLSSVITQVEQAVGRGAVALDVGCGSGRDMVFLASRQWTVIGIENRKRLLACAHMLADRFKVRHRVAGIIWDVKKGSSAVRHHSYHLLHCCRFIHRPSLPRFIDGLAEGGFVVYSHFLEGCEKTEIGHPKNSSGFFLRGELESILRNCHVSILSAEEHVLHDGRPMIHVIGRKESKTAN